MSERERGWLLRAVSTVTLCFAEFHKGDKRYFNMVFFAKLIFSKTGARNLKLSKLQRL